ncbi:MAG: hypothetical protein ACSLEY_00835 [Candidatus Saccharimonadales bacterium]
MDHKEIRQIKIVENRQLADRDEAPGTTVGRRVIYFIVGFITILLALRITSLLLVANRDNTFVDFLYGFSGVFAAPFFGIFNYQSKHA